MCQCLKQQQSINYWINLIIGFTPISWGLGQYLLFYHTLSFPLVLLLSLLIIDSKKCTVLTNNYNKKFIQNTYLKLILCYSLTKIYCPNNGGPKHVLATSICGWVTKWFRGHVVVCKPRGKLIVTNITIVIVGISMLDKCSTRGLDLILSWAV